MIDQLHTAEVWLASPQWLWALLGLVPFILIELLLRSGVSWPRRIAMSLTRAAVLACVLVALTIPMLSLSRPAHDVIFLVDTSASVSEKTLEQARARVQSMRAELGSDTEPGLVLFDQEARVAVFPGQDWSTSGSWRAKDFDPKKGGTNIASALELGVSLVRQRASGEIILFTDARPTTGRLEASVQLARTRNIPISTIALTTSRGEPLLRKVALSETEVRPGQTINGKIQVAGATRAFRGVMKIRIDGSLISQQEVEIPAEGDVEIPFSHEVGMFEEARAGRVEVSLESDALKKTLTQHAQFMILGKPKVLMITSALEEIEPLSRVLKAEGMEPSVLQMKDLASRPPDLDKLDLVILANAPAKWPEKSQHTGPVMSEAFINRLQKYVSRGGGLVVLAGDKSYGLGGYGETKMLDFMPVELDPEEVKVSRPATMLMVLDNSGSMGARVGRTTKIRLAARGALEAVKVLRPEQDYYGVMTVDTRPSWRVRIQPAKITSQAAAQTRSVYARGGGIYVYTALVHADIALRSAKTPVKHIVIFSDAADAAEQYSGHRRRGGGESSYSLARRLAARGITTSVIGIGRRRDRDVRFLRKLAKAGRGRFYLTSDAHKLKAFFIKEAKQLTQRHLQESNFKIKVVAKKHPILQGIDWSRVPVLRGHVELKARPTAEVLWTGPKDKPVLTTWQYGLGQVVSLSTDAGPRWASRWLPWDGYSKFWTQTARWALRRREGDAVSAKVQFDGQDAVIDVVEERGKERKGAMRAMVRELGSEDWRPVPLQTARPGTRRAIVEVAPNTAYELGLVDDAGEPLLKRAFTSPPPVELRHTSPDRAMLANLSRQTQGVVEPKAAIDDPKGVRLKETPLWLLLLIAAVLLLPVDAAARRAIRDR